MFAKLSQFFFHFRKLFGESNQDVSSFHFDSSETKPLSSQEPWVKIQL